MTHAKRLRACADELETVLRACAEAPAMEDGTEPCRCAKPAPLVPGAKCRKCHRWTVAAVDADGSLRTVPSNQDAADWPNPRAEALAPPAPGWIEQRLRTEWWLGHGCPFAALYGDDGEMQCNNIARHGSLDFKRDDLLGLKSVVESCRLEALAPQRADARDRKD